MGSPIGLAMALASVSWLMAFVLQAGFIASAAVVLSICLLMRFAGVTAVGEETNP